MIKPIKTLSETYDINDEFWIDTNVLIFLHCPIRQNTNQEKAAIYSNFIQKLKKAGCSLHVSTMTLQEVFHAVEKINCDINHKSAKVKSLRANKSIRHKLARMQKDIWNQVTAMYAIVDETIDSAKLAKYINDYENHSYDPIDFLSASRPSVKIISDDRDFESDKNVTLYKA